MGTSHLSRARNGKVAGTETHSRVSESCTILTALLRPLCPPTPPAPPTPGLSTGLGSPFSSLGFYVHFQPEILGSQLNKPGLSSSSYYRWVRSGLAFEGKSYPEPSPLQVVHLSQRTTMHYHYSLSQEVLPPSKTAWLALCLSHAFQGNRSQFWPRIGRSGRWG